MKLPVPKFHASRPGEKELTVTTPWRLTSSRVCSGRVLAARNRVWSRTESTLFECRFSRCKAVGLRELHPPLGQGRKNEIRGVERPSRNLGCGMMLVRVLRLCRHRSDCADRTPGPGRSLGASLHLLLCTVKPSARPTPNVPQVPPKCHSGAQKRQCEPRPSSGSGNVPVTGT